MDPKTNSDTPGKLLVRQELILSITDNAHTQRCGALVRAQEEKNNCT